MATRAEKLFAKKFLGQTKKAGRYDEAVLLLDAAVIGQIISVPSKAISLAAIVQKSGKDKNAPIYDEYGRLRSDRVTSRLISDLHVRVHSPDGRISHSVYMSTARYHHQRSAMFAFKCLIPCRCSIFVSTASLQRMDSIARIKLSTLSSIRRTRSH